MKNGSATKKGIRPAAAGQIKDLCAVAVQGIPAKMSFDDAEAALRRKERFIKHIQSFFREMPTELPRNLSAALIEAEAFTKKAFNQTVNLAEMFDFSNISLERDVIAAYLPKGMDYAADVLAMKKAGDGLVVYEEEKVNTYSNSQARDLPRLYLFDRDERPEKSTMGLSPDQLVAKVKEGEEYLGLGAYAVGMGTYHEATGRYLDSGKTITWFPKDRFSDDARVAYGYWHPGNREVRFHWCGSALAHDLRGARLAKEVPLKP